MLFNSHIFIFVFLPLLLAGWYFLNYKRKFMLAQGYLIGMSLWFYAYVNAAYLWLLLGSCIVGWSLSLLPEKISSKKGVNAAYLWLLLGSCIVGWSLSLLPEKISSKKGRKWIIAAGCAFHLGLLGYFKYSNFFLENINAAVGTDFSMMHIVMPVGISFYTFQQLAYLIDRCRGEAPKDSFWDYLTFMVYFPQLLQGPIMLRDELIPQLHEPERRRFDAGRFSEGIQFFIIGLSKKVLLADTLAKAVNFGYSNTAGLDSISAVFLAAGYLTELYFDFSGYCDMAVGIGKMVGIEVAENFDSPFKSASVKEFWRAGYLTELYFDFSGYCDMAVGIGKMVGIEVAENFDSPFKSASVKEFWRRWHMTLGRFFTRYVYIPLGGSRRGKARTLCNVMIVMLLSGLWHGAAWTFVLWGFLHGLGMMWDNIKRKGLPCRWINQLLTFLYVSLTFVFFRAESIAQGFLVIGKMFSFQWNGDKPASDVSLCISDVCIFPGGEHCSGIFGHRENVFLSMERFFTGDCAGVGDV